MTRTRKQPSGEKWRKAERRYREMEKKLRPFVRRPETAETPKGSSWRRTGDVRDTGLRGFISEA